MVEDVEFFIYLILKEFIMMKIGLVKIHNFEWENTEIFKANWNRISGEIFF